MSTAFRLVRTMTRKGNVILGTGCYSAALKSTKSDEDIIKISNNLADPCLFYYTKVLPQVKNNPHTPKIKTIQISEDNDFYVTTMEKLDQIVGTNPILDIIKFSVKFIEGSLTECELLEASSNFPTEIPVPHHWMYLLQAIKVHTDYTSLDDAEGNEGNMLDLHIGNFMTRNGVLVITDPWCETDMDYVDDFSQWAEDNIDTKHFVSVGT